MKKIPITKTWNAAKQCIKDGNLVEAEEAISIGIILMAEQTRKGIPDSEILEGTRKDIWYDRFWLLMEKHIWPTYPDYELNWR